MECPRILQHEKAAALRHELHVIHEGLLVVGILILVFKHLSGLQLLHILLVVELDRVKPGHPVDLDDLVHLFLKLFYFV